MEELLKIQLIEPPMNGYRIHACSVSNADGDSCNIEEATCVTSKYTRGQIPIKQPTSLIMYVPSQEKDS